MTLYGENITWLVCMFRNSQTLFDWNGFFTAAFTAGIERGKPSKNSEVKRKLHEHANPKFQNGLKGTMGQK